MGPDYSRPPAPVESEWTHSQSPGISDLPASLAYWWAQFNDPVLDGLIDRAVAMNPDLRQAAFRVYEARWRRGVVRGGLFPQADATAAYSYKKISGNGSPYAVTSQGGFSWNSLGFDAAWELDFWGKYRRAVESANAEIGVSTANYNDVLVTLLGDVAATYVHVRVFEERLAVARENEAIQKKTLALVEARHQAGLAKSLDVAQARSNLYTTVAAIPTLIVGLEQSENRLAVLMGEPPGNIRAVLDQETGIPVATGDVAVGVPADLLRRRPDVSSAERTVAAESARIGVAVAELYPQFSLKGMITVDSTDLTTIFSPESIAHNVGPSMKWNILNFGRLRNAIRAQRARYQQAVAGYVSTVLSAAEEVENALTANVREHDRMRALGQGAEAARESVRLSVLYYEQGLINFQTVLDSQRSLLSLQEQLAASQGTLAISRIAIYKALGGGWQSTGNGCVPFGSAGVVSVERIPPVTSRPEAEPSALAPPTLVPPEVIPPHANLPEEIPPATQPQEIPFSPDGS